MPGIIVMIKCMYGTQVKENSRFAMLKVLCDVPFGPFCFAQTQVAFSCLLCHRPDSKGAVGSGSPPKQKFWDLPLHGTEINNQ